MFLISVYLELLFILIFIFFCLFVYHDRVEMGLTQMKVPRMGLVMLCKICCLFDILYYNVLLVDVQPIVVSSQPYLMLDLKLFSPLVYENMLIYNLICFAEIF